MGCFIPIFVAAVVSLVCYGVADKKVWTKNTNYNNTNNWFPRRLPSESDLAVFPVYMKVEIMLSSDISICEMVLPYTGSIFFPTEGTLQINGRHCDSKNKVTFIRSQIEIWENPLNWSNMKMNKATPHAFRIPCSFDDVLFPPGSTFAVGLPPTPTTIKSFNINNQDLDSQELRSFLVDSVSGRKQFIKDDDDDPTVPIVSGIGCLDLSGCSCGTERLIQLTCEVYSSRLCAAPKCLDPVKPVGHCCDICGVVLEFQYDQKKFKISELRILLKSFASQVQNEQNLDLVFHAGKTDSGTIQVVLAEKDGYEGLVSDVAHQLQEKILSDKKLGLSHYNFLLSGEPYDPSEVLGVFKTFFAIILIVIVGFFCVMMYRSDLNFDQFFNSATFTNFVRFENQTGEVELRYEVQPQLRKSFYNPLFQNTAEDDEDTKPEQVTDELPSTSYGDLTQEMPVSELKDDTDNVEMDEIPATKLQEKLLQDVDLG